MIYRKSLFVSVALACMAGASPCFAQSAGQAAALAAAPASEGDTITVLATGSAMPVDQAGQAISVIGADEIASVQGSDVTRVLTRLPGLSLDRDGGIGAATSVFVRGANSEQLLVLIDGVRVADVAAPSGGYDFGGLLSGGISRIELLRGSNSVVWGSDAIGGVMAITSEEVNGAQATVEGGAHGTISAEGGAGIKREDWALSLAGGYFHSDGIAAEPAVVNGNLANGFAQWHLSGRGRLGLAPGLDLVVSGRYADATAMIDSYADNLPYAYGNYGDWQRTRNGSGRVGLTYDATGVSLQAGIAYADTRRAYVDPPSGTLVPDYATDGSAVHLDASGHVMLPGQFAIDAGLDAEWSRFVDTYDSPANTALASGHALLGWRGLGDRLELSAGERVDRHSTFGTHWTFGANGSYRLIADVRLRASYGEGFKAPTLYQLLAQDYGNPNLRPETSKSYDVALEKGSRNGPLHAGVTWFARDTTNLIDFVDCYALVLPGCIAQPNGYYQNIGEARAQGFELEGDARVGKRLQLHASFSHVISRDLSEGSPAYGKDLARRPRDVGSLSADWRVPLGLAGPRALTLGADVRASGPSWDDAANSVRLGGYTTVDLRASVPVTERIELYGRIENVGDVRYHTAAGYAAYGRSAYVGVRAKL